ncbi:hypothetical protein QYE76_016695 [Lolium multiflorum]|uniref:CCHC-type domain-containing protein n=1 Tax=Lolium multiflorum TaxID=4521 RepID=A0AAD8QEF6_LOLMU|nr:hypothetical protein QYE76_016695 [Lolium multiflorum]
MQMGLLTGTDCAPPPEIVAVPADREKGVPAQMKVNPDYASWISRDQIVLSYLLQALHPKEVVPHVHRIETSVGVWRAIEQMFAAQSKVRVDNMLVALANTKKLQSTTSEYLAKMQGFADELVAAGHPLQDRQLVSYILAGVGKDYNSLVAALGVATTPITLSMLCSQLHSYDQSQLLLDGHAPPDFESSANAASKQGRPRSDYYNTNYSNNYNGRPHDRGDRRDDRHDDHGDRRDNLPYNQGRDGGRGPPGGGRGRGQGRRCTTPWVDVTCQICSKEGHYAKDCWSRYSHDEKYGDKEIHAAYGVDTNWYEDSGATHHITSELNNLTLRDNYRGYDKVTSANGQVGRTSYNAFGEEIGNILTLQSNISVFASRRLLGRREHGEEAVRDCVPASMESVEAIGGSDPDGSGDLYEEGWEERVGATDGVAGSQQIFSSAIVSHSGDAVLTAGIPHTRKLISLPLSISLPMGILSRRRFPISAEDRGSFTAHRLSVLVLGSTEAAASISTSALSLYRTDCSGFWRQAVSIRNAGAVPLSSVVGSRIPPRLQPDSQVHAMHVLAMDDRAIISKIVGNSNYTMKSMTRALELLGLGFITNVKMIITDY